RHTAEELSQLKGPCDPHGGVNMRRLAAHAPATQNDLATVRLQVAGEHVDERRLARAVGADEPDQISLGDGELDRIAGEDAAEALAELLGPDELPAPAHDPESFCGTSLAVIATSALVSPSRTNWSQSGVSRPLRAKRMVSSRRTPK